MNVLLEGELPTDPRARINTIESVTQAICQGVGADPADAVFSLLVAAVKIASKHSGVPLPEVEDGIRRVIGQAVVTADEMFDLGKSRTVN